MAEVRQRKPNASAVPDTTTPTPTPDDADDKKATKTAAPASGYDVGILSVAVAVVAILALTGLAVAAILHFLDPLQYLTLPPPPASSSSAANDNDNTGLRTFTPAALAAHSGTDPALPLLLAINGTVHDVSSGRPFYGPGGPYAHFAGRDATRAWVTECFTDGLTAAERDDEGGAFAAAQLTSDTRGLPAMFAPLWLDEALQDAADGLPVAADAAALFPAASVPAGTTLPEALRAQARVAVGRMPGGKVGAEERRERREADAVEAREAVERALGKWVAFFAAGGKYPVVGRMVGLEVGEGEPPALCEKARKKRPIKGGRLEPMMGMMQKMMGGAGAGSGAGSGAGAGAAAGAGAGQKGSPGQMPDFVKQMLEKREKEKKGKQ